MKNKSIQIEINADTEYTNKLFNLLKDRTILINNFSENQYQSQFLAGFYIQILTQIFLSIILVIYFISGVIELWNQ